MATGSELPQDLQSTELLSQALLGDEEDDCDKILSQLPSLESLDAYFPQNACNYVQNTTSINRFRDPVIEEEVKAAQKAVVNSSQHAEKYHLDSYCVEGMESVKMESIF